MEITQAPIVEQVTPETMQGDNMLEKALNALLTKSFVVSRNAPADECLNEARVLIKTNFNKEALMYYLKNQFGIRNADDIYQEVIADNIISLINNFKEEQKAVYEIWKSVDEGEWTLLPADSPQHEFLTTDVDDRKMVFVSSFTATYKEAKVKFEEVHLCNNATICS